MSECADCRSIRIENDVRYCIERERERERERASNLSTAAPHSLEEGDPFDWKVDPSRQCREYGTSLSLSLSLSPSSLQSGDWNSFIAANGESDRERRLEGRCESELGQKEGREEERDLAQQSSRRARTPHRDFLRSPLSRCAQASIPSPISRKCCRRAVGFCSGSRCSGGKNSMQPNCNCPLCVIHKFAGSVADL